MNQIVETENCQTRLSSLRIDGNRHSHQDLPSQQKHQMIVGIEAKAPIQNRYTTNSLSSLLVNRVNNNSPGLVQLRENVSKIN